MIRICPVQRTCKRLVLLNDIANVVMRKVVIGSQTVAIEMQARTLSVQHGKVTL